jgi:hypothetical protein
MEQSQLKEKFLAIKFVLLIGFFPDVSPNLLQIFFHTFWRFLSHFDRILQDTYWEFQRRVTGQP